jgi:hypothetical protein
MDSGNLIDPLNEDTYGRGAIIHGPIKTKVPNEAYRKGWERIFGYKRMYFVWERKARSKWFMPYTLQRK